ncbi:RedY [Pseudoalteromonas denitrificans]|jgi:hypothetical protein|uniref:REDY-like protein HapK n=1 Tax=Pseudoalteromonas denitrificans DSM 6059 TaxID=1123010 RepID=A0A1I1G7N3_9GAMM|nr:RedY [Pseudoalteromonas denitrificans]SFC05383.1 REDY-like protein HapK [Pseudoalteromonas denitrificans DSM 6059]
MKIMIHKIKLKEIKSLSDFRDWVLTTDYLACHDLPSVLQFDVIEVSTDKNADFHFIEVIRLSSLAEFEKDMNSPLFNSLESRFNEMAQVVEENEGDLIGNGYSSF